MSVPAAPAQPDALSLTRQVSPDTRRLATRANLDAAGQQFEAIFVNMMLKSMRTASLGTGLLDNDASRQFRDMQDQRLAEAMAAHAPIGIGRAMTDFLWRNAGLNGGDAAAATAADTGGTSPP